jgi:integrase
MCVMKTYNVQLNATELSQLEAIRANKVVMSINALYNKAITEYWSKDRYVASGWKKEVVNLFKANIHKQLGKKKLDQLSPVEVRKWHQSMGSTPTNANRSLAVLSRLYSFAEEEGILPPGSNPCSNVARFSEKKRKRYATKEEIQKLGAILERERQEFPREVTFIYLLLLTGARPSSIGRTRPDQITRLQFEGETYGILKFNGKTSSDSGEEEIVPIPPKCMALLDSLDPDRKTLTGIKMPREFWERIRNEAGCPDLWARDLRRTFATVGLSQGVSMDIIGGVLNHRRAQTTKIYGLLMQEERLGAVAQISDKMAELIKV